MRSLLRAIDFISEWSGKIISYLWIVLVLVTMHEVIMRYGFGAPTAWGFETMIFICAIVYMIGGAFTLKQRRHVNMEVVYQRFSPRGRAILDLITFPLFFLFVGVLVWAGGARFIFAATIGETTGSPWNPPIYPIWLMIPVGSFLLILSGLAKFVDDLMLAITGRKYR